jgi:NADH-quinone oxidoreductase subunit N
MSFFSNDFKTLLPELFLVFSICGLLLFGAILSTRKIEKTSSLNISINTNKSNPIIMLPVLWLGFQILFLASLLTLNTQVLRASLFFSSLEFDSLGLGTKSLVYGFAGLCLIAAKDYLKNQGIFAFEYVILVLLSSLGLGLMILSKDLLSFYLSLELQALSLYVLASFKRSSAFSTEAGIKYFIIGAFASGLTLFGISLIFGATATTNFENLERLSLELNSSEVSLLFLLGLVFLTAGLLFKLAAAPFHMWIADVYEGAPTASTIFFAVVPKIGLIALFIKLYFTAFYGLLSFWQNLLLLAAVFSMLVGSFAALYQRKVKRFLAYSAIGQVGYLLVGLSVGTFEGLEAVLLYMMIYSVMSLLVWTALLSTETWLVQKNNQPVKQPAPIIYIDELAALGKLNPSFSAAIAIAFFSMAGVPPLAGFFSKFYVFFTAVESSYYLLAMIGLLTSVVSSFYYLRWLKFLYFEKASLSTPPKLNSSVYSINMSREKSLIISGASFFLISFFLYPAPLFLFAHWMSLALV